MLAQAAGRVKAYERGDVGSSGSISLENDDVSQCDETTRDRADDQSQKSVLVANPCTYRCHQLDIATAHRMNHEEQEKGASTK